MSCLSETSQNLLTITPMIARSAGKMWLPTQPTLPSWPSKRKMLYKTLRTPMNPKWRKSSNFSNRSKTIMSRSRNFWGPAMSVVTSALLESATIKKKSTTQKKIFHSIWSMKNRAVLRWRMSVSLWLRGDRARSSSSLWRSSNKSGCNRRGTKFLSKPICLIALRTVPCFRKMRVDTPSFPSPKTQNARSNCLPQKVKNTRISLPQNKIINTPLPMISRKRRNNLRLKVKHLSAIKFWGKALLENRKLCKSHKKLWKAWPIKKKSFQFLKDQFNQRGIASWFPTKLKWICRRVGLRLRRASFDPATLVLSIDNPRKSSLLEWALRHSKAQTTFLSLPSRSQSKLASRRNPALSSKNAPNLQYSTTHNKNQSRLRQHPPVQTTPQKS